MSSNRYRCSGGTSASSQQALKLSSLETNEGLARAHWTGLGDFPTSYITPYRCDRLMVATDMPTDLAIAFLTPLRMQERGADDSALFFLSTRQSVVPVSGPAQPEGVLESALNDYGLDNVYSVELAGSCDSMVAVYKIVVTVTIANDLNWGEYFTSPHRRRVGLHAVGF